MNVWLFLALCLAGPVLYIFVEFFGGSGRRKNAVNALKEYQFPALVKDVFRREHPNLTENSVTLAFEGLKEYFLLLKMEQLAGRKSKLGMPSVVVDGAWHAFVLCTAQYQEFCMKFFGEMIHHVPDPGSRPGKLESGTRFKDDVMNTWRAYQHGAASQPGYFTTYQQAPLLFSLDSALGVPGWLWSAEALTSLDMQARQMSFAETARGSSSRQTSSENAGSSCASASMPLFDSASGSGHTTSKGHGGGHHDGSDHASGGHHGGGDVGGSSCGSSCGSGCGGGGD